MAPLTGLYVACAYFGSRVSIGKGSFIYITQTQLSCSPVVVSCPFSTYDFATGKCVASISLQQFQTYVTGAISTPYILMLLQLSPIVFVIDEFSYYVYHSASYDRGFKFFAQLCW